MAKIHVVYMINVFLCVSVCVRACVRACVCVVHVHVVIVCEYVHTCTYKGLDN